MNGRDLTLGALAGLAVAGLVVQRRGSRKVVEKPVLIRTIVIPARPDSAARQGWSASTGAIWLNPNGSLHAIQSGGGGVSVYPVEGGVPALPARAREAVEQLARDARIAMPTHAYSVSDAYSKGGARHLYRALAEVVAKENAVLISSACTDGRTSPEASEMWSKLSSEICVVDARDRNSSEWYDEDEDLDLAGDDCFVAWGGPR